MNTKKIAFLLVPLLTAAGIAACEQKKASTPAGSAAPAPQVQSAPAAPADQAAQPPAVPAEQQQPATPAAPSGQK